jgi:hypothetical protein
VFYSLYVLDRLLSADFGIPIMLNDTDIDTCIPGDREKHASEDSSTSKYNQRVLEERRIFTPSAVDSDHAESVEPQPPRKRQRVAENGRVSSVEAEPIFAPDREMDETARKRLAPACSLINMARMIGRAMETFNKSVNHRCINGERDCVLCRGVTRD